MNMHICDLNKEFGLNKKNPESFGFWKKKIGFFPTLLGTNDFG